MEIIKLEEITHENIIGFAKDGINEFTSLKENKDTEYGMVADWRVKYHDVWLYIDRLRKRSQKRLKQLHLKSTKTDVIAQYQDNADLFENFLKTAALSGKFLYELTGMDIEEDGLIPVIHRKYQLLPFTRDVHQALIKSGLTEISCLCEIPKKKDNRLNIHGRRKRNYALQAMDYMTVEGVHNSAEDNGLHIEPEEFINVENREVYPIKSKWISKLYPSRGSMKFHLFVPMENEYWQKIFLKIKCAKAISSIAGNAYRNLSV